MTENYAVIDIGTSAYPGAECKIDQADLELVSRYKWGIAYMGGVGYKLAYARTRIGGRKNASYIRMHRLIMGAAPGVEVDHINGDTLDNRRCNLRVATRLEQSRNTGMRKNNSTGFKGVSYIEKLRKFRAYIVVNRKQIHLGLFVKAEDAAAAYEKSASELFGEFHRKIG